MKAKEETSTTTMSITHSSLSEKNLPQTIVVNGVAYYSPNALVHIQSAWYELGVAAGKAEVISDTEHSTKKDDGEIRTENAELEMKSNNKEVEVKESGYQEGFDKGYKEGFDKGYKEGLEEWEESKTDVEIAFKSGYDRGYNSASEFFIDEFQLKDQIDNDPEPELQDYEAEREWRLYYGN
jgi:hypothetical protein